VKNTLLLLLNFTITISLGILCTLVFMTVNKVHRQTWEKQQAHLDKFRKKYTGATMDPVDLKG